MSGLDYMIFKVFKGSKMLFSHIIFQKGLYSKN